MNSVEKTVVVVSLIMTASAVAFVITPYMNFSLLEGDPSDEVSNGMPPQYSKTVNITVERTFDNQPDISEEITSRIVVNTDKSVARSEFSEVFKRKSLVSERNNRTSYTDGGINRTYLYPSNQTIENSQLPVIKRGKLDSFNKTEKFGLVRLSSTESEFVGLVGFNVKRYITSENVESVDYSVKYDSDSGLLRKYEITATSDSENIRVESTYDYNSPNITSVEISNNNGTLSYQAKSEVITAQSVASGNIVNLNSQDGNVTLEKGDDIRDYELFEILRVSDNTGRVTHEHILTEDKVIISQI